MFIYWIHGGATMVLMVYRESRGILNSNVNLVNGGF